MMGLVNAAWVLTAHAPIFLNLRKDAAREADDEESSSAVINLAVALVGFALSSTSRRHLDARRRVASSWRRALQNTLADVSSGRTQTQSSRAYSFGGDCCPPSC